MERRKAKVNISSAGGTAGKGAKTYKVTLPTTWVERLGITEEHRELDLAFDGRRIILSQRLSGSEFAKRQRAQGHAVRAFRLYDGDQLCSTIYADFTEQTVMVENQAVPPIKTAFGNNPVPSWEDFQRFLEERCIPRQRAGLREKLTRLPSDKKRVALCLAGQALQLRLHPAEEHGPRPVRAAADDAQANGS